MALLSCVLLMLIPEVCCGLILSFDSYPASPILVTAGSTQNVTLQCQVNLPSNAISSVVISDPSGTERTATTTTLPPSPALYEITLNAVQPSDSGNYTCSATASADLMTTDHIDECASSQCQNGGVCRDAVNGFQCTCAPGYDGVVCEVDIDECASCPCQNGGVCRDAVNSFQCTCAPGYDGVVCEVDINECASSPCQNGLCDNLVDGFRCFCRPGFSGFFCGVELNECDSDPCRNGATCQDAANDVICFCVLGFTGKYCETDINECESDLCNNGSTCLDLINGFQCLCLPGFDGHFCERGWYGE
ncbi:fibropellin-3-like [Patiria miniata]|uniref:Uncharacterized protein n=1 Tax=Patiria miniata TaxID=46514 RepID=A0A914ATD2_PATMI|nr:fibropellin-3-like [Patiria miniata]